MTDQQQEMIEYTTQEVIRYIIEDNKIPMEKAMEMFFLSKTFGMLTDTATGLYLEGSLYIYDLLLEESSV